MFIEEDGWMVANMTEEGMKIGKVMSGDGQMDAMRMEREA